ncbi:alpha/beta hydrolase [Novosphingobium sp. G106]|uniref:alpha/beta fold hydrolase n=1 Tax=Novosphingobium sp. G106 TaxID=2849500 RepID=UPI001C2D129A|nr:alpha/beta fold hydrolase [Novosphingobium sp. G106]MBV1687308.1 alpha/beta hydrolase [Novosphingobium sp. G106]
MARSRANGIEIEYELSGPEGGPVLMLIHGVGAQLIRWPPALIERFERAGFRTLRFDNRDVGLSSHLNHLGIPDIAAIVAARAAGGEPELPYSLSDMAADTAGLLDALGIAQAHVLGVSLGGMVGQVLAIEHRARVRSLNLFMTQSGNPDLPPSDPGALAILSKRAPDPQEDREAFLSHQAALNRALGSPDYPAPESELRAFAALAADRAYNPAGPARQLAAARGAPDRRPQLRALSVPALVVHGRNDPLFPPECGTDLARSIPGSWLLEPGGMGHDLPAELIDLFVETVRANCARA